MKKQHLVLWFLLLIAANGFWAQNASPVCANTTTLTNGTYTNLTSTNQVGWYLYNPTTSNSQITLINYNNNQLFKINKIEVLVGSCESGTVIATDSLLNSNDSILTINLSSLDPINKYYIKILRQLTFAEPTAFSLSILAPEYCGFSWSTAPPLQTGYDPINFTYTYNYSFGCFANNTNGSTTSNPNWNMCTANISSCQSSFPIIYISYGQATNGPGTWLQMNAVLAVVPNVPNTTYTTQTGATASLALSLNTPGATTYTLYSLQSCDANTVTAASTGTDFACACNSLVINVAPFSCEINIPPILCANQPFCYAGLNYANTVAYPDEAFISTVTFAQPIGGGPSIPGTNFDINTATYTNTFCFPNGLPAGNYNIVYNSTASYIINGVPVIDCTCTNTVPLSVNNPPTGPTSITANPISICEGETTTLTATSAGANNYLWFPGNINNSQIAVTPTIATTYTAIAYAGSCPGPAGQITIEPINCCRFPKNQGVNFTNVTIQPSNFGGSTLPWSSIVPGGTYNGVSIAAPPSGNITLNIALSGSLIVNASNVTFNNCNFLFSEAAVIIQNGSNTTFDITYLHACTKNWIGIKTYNSLNIRNSVIEDAVFAVNLSALSTNHPPITIENTLFNLNFYGLYSISKTIPNLNIRGCIFTSRVINPALYTFTGAPWQYSSGLTTVNLTSYPVGLLKGSTVLGISNLIKGNAGVLLFNSVRPSANQYITIGDATNGNATNQFNYRNVYDALQFGIYAINSNFSSINSIYQNINVSSGSASTSAGVFQDKGKMIVGSSSTGPNAAINTNTFVNSEYGVKSTNNAVFTIANNRFNSISFYATHVYQLYSSAAVAPLNYITNNNFNTCLIDFFAYDNVKCNIDFSNNTSVYPIITGSKFRIPVMAQLNELAKPATALYNVSFNNETGKMYGVIAQNVQSATVQNNNLNGQPHPAGGFNAGITLQNTDNSQILNNIINHTPNANTSFNNYGILTDIGVNNTYCENTITGSGTCMKWQGTSPSIIKRNSLNEAPLNPCQFGIWLDNFASVGDINTVSSGTVCNDNRFGDFGFADTYSQNSSFSSRIDYSGIAVNTNPFYPAINGFASGGIVCIPFFNSNTGIVNCGPVVLNQKLSKGVPPFVTSAIVYPANNANSNHIAKKSIYELFKKTSFNTSLVSGYPAFMAAQAAANAGTFYNVDSLARLYSNSGNTLQLQQAKNQNLALVPANTIDANQQNFNSIYHTYLTNPNSVSAAQLANLQTLAQLCPFTDGTSVYQARALLRYYDDSTYYSNACEFNAPVTGGSSRLANQINNSSENVALTTMVFPNPANTELIITTELEGAEIVITNIIGQVVLKTTLTSKTILNVSELSAGTYVYNIKKDYKVIKADKLIIKH